jgi:hypothetical protein
MKTLTFEEAKTIKLGSRVKCVAPIGPLIEGAVYIVTAIREEEDQKFRQVLFSLAMHSQEYDARRFSHVQWADTIPEPSPSEPDTPSRNKLLDAYYHTVETGIF